LEDRKQLTRCRLRAFVNDTIFLKYYSHNFL
jgi:hypothetical protein